MKNTNDSILEMALNMAGVKTDKYTRDLFTETIKKVEELGADFALSDFINIKTSLCDKHNLDYDTLHPIKHKNKKILVAKITNNGHEYYVNKLSDYSKDPNDAHDFKTFDFAEKMIINNNMDGVFILPYYKKEEND